MKLNVDLNNLNNQELENLLALFKSGKAIKENVEKKSIKQKLIEEITETEPIMEGFETSHKKKRRKFKTENRNTKAQKSYNEVVEFIANHKKPISISKAFKKALKRKHCGGTQQASVRKLIKKDNRIACVNGLYFLGNNVAEHKSPEKERQLSKKETEKNKRNSFIMKRTAYFMRTMNVSRERGWKMATMEWNKQPTPNIELFDWNKLIGRNATQLRESFLFAYSQNKKVQYSDVAHLLDGVNDYLTFLKNVMIYSENIKKDTGIEHNFVFDSNAILFK